MAVPDEMVVRIQLAGRATTTIDQLEALAAYEGEGQEMVLAAIGEQRRPATFPVLAAQLSSPSAAVRASAVVAIVRADPRAAREPLLSMLDDPSDEVRRAAADNARTIATPDDVPALTALASDPDPRVQQQALWALAATGDPAALQPLKERLLEDTNGSTRRVARRALIWSAIPGADAVLKESALGSSWRRARGARRAAANAARAGTPTPRVVPVTQVAGRVGTIVGLILSLAMLSVPIAADRATILGSAAAFLLTWVPLRLLRNPLMRNENGGLGMLHDRARFERHQLPDGARILGPAEKAARAATGTALWRGVVPAAVLVGLELVIPAGGLISGVGAGLFVFFDGMMAHSRGVIERAPQRTYIEVDRTGGPQRRVWIGP